MKLKKGALVKRLAIITLLVLGSSYIFYSCAKKSAVKTYNRDIQRAPYDVIIVPGVPFQDSVWQDIMKIRVYWSKYLYDNGHTQNIIYTGGAVYTPYVESIIMREYAIALGIPEEKIFTEIRAEHSTENLYYSYHLAKEHGFEKIALATDPFQGLMLKKFAKKENLDVGFLPMQIDTLKLIEKINPPIDPSSAFVEDFVSIKKREGFFKRWRGTMGKNIDRIPTQE